LNKEPLVGGDQIILLAGSYIIYNCNITLDFFITSTNGSGSEVNAKDI